MQVADAQGATYLVTTRRETVDNLLRRSDVTVGDGEMVVVDTTRRDAYRLRYGRVFPDP